MKIITDIKLWEILFSSKSSSSIKKREKFSRAEAFFDLIRKHKMAMLTTGDSQINSNITQLADQWGWTRYSVKIFLDELQKLGALQLKPYGNITLVSLCNIIEQDGA